VSPLAAGNGDAKQQVASNEFDASTGSVRLKGLCMDRTFHFVGSPTASGSLLRICCRPTSCVELGGYLK
jgi:hypothetical protein